MDKEQLVAILATLTGHLHSQTKEEEQTIDQLQLTVANTLLQQNLNTITNQEFSFESSDLFFSQNIKEARLSNIENIVKQALENKAGEDLRLFVRDVAVRSTQVPGSVPEWAAGANVETTRGPFLNREGRRVWFDFFRVEKLIALYIQGQTLPAILFKSSLVKRPLIIGPQQPPEITKQYKVVQGSVWIRAAQLCATAPADRYCGIKVKGGTITLDAAPQLQNNKLVIAANNNVQVSLDLVQQPVADADNSSTHGIDARNASFVLPEKFVFSFAGANKTIKEIAAGKWKVYGDAAEFKWEGNQATEYDTGISRLLIPMAYGKNSFAVSKCQSPFTFFSGEAKIKQSFWALSAALLDVNNPLQAEGSGAWLLRCDKGIQCTWQGLDASDIFLHAPIILGEPGRIGISDLSANAAGASQHFDLWKDEKNPHGTSADLTFLEKSTFIYNTIAKGDEVLITVCDAKIETDRPVKVNGEPVPVRSKKSLLLLAASHTQNIIYLYDDNIIWDNKLPAEKTPSVKPYALALENALFTVSPVNGCLLFGECDKEWEKVTTGNLLLTFGMFSYLPTLPDPYIANLGILKRQFENRERLSNRMWLWLVCLVNFKPKEEDKDEVKVSFHFGNMPAQQQNAENLNVNSDSTNVSSQNNLREMLRAENLERVSENESTESLRSLAFSRTIPDYKKVWDDRFGNSINTDAFALLDVSSNANQLGVSFSLSGGNRMQMLRTADVVAVNSAASDFPFQVQEMHVVARGSQVRAFMLPLVSWEPVANLSPKIQPMDPVPFWNYYPDDGGPTRIFNNGQLPVPLSPLPLVEYLFHEFNSNPNNKTIASFTLPFGMNALALMYKNQAGIEKPKLENVDPTFKNDLKGGMQIMAHAGKYDVKPAAEPNEKDSNMFPGYVLQINNVIGWDGSVGASTLGDSVTRVYNNEFFTTPLTFNDPPEGRGVPVTRIDFTGYGANMFSNWLSPSAQFAATSQARFDVMLGRTAHEVVQIKSIIYPWGIRVVRTITVFRVSTGYVYRVDSGWKAESDGRFDFRYRYIEEATPDPPPGGTAPTKEVTPYQIHPGVISGLFNVQNIIEDASVADYKSTNIIPTGGKYINGITGKEHTNTGVPITEEVLCRPVWFDADVEIENVVLGHKDGRVSSKKILGYVQLAPTGKPLTEQQFKGLLEQQAGSIGGPVDCVVDINKSSQQMRINRFDVNVSVGEANSIAFAVAARGNVFLPKDGSWSIVQHNVGTGEVTPLPESITVPLIRKGKWIKDKVIDPDVINKELTKIAHPMELIRNAVADTNNFGFLQSTDTQKALFLTPSYAKATEMLLSKTPPVFADAYRLMSGNGIFPNIGNAIDNFGKAMPLLNSNGVQAFTEKALTDGSKVFELLKVEAEKKGAEAVKQGMSLLQKGADGILNKALDFDVPSFEVPLVEMDGLKIYIDYKTGKRDEPPASYVNSKLKFDVNSFAGDMADQWKSRLNNLAMVVDLGSFKRLMTIKGNFDSGKGKETGYAGDTGGQGGMPVPEIEFSKELQPLIDLLELLASLSSGDYAETLKKGLKIAMSNSGEIWEYKFEAKKEIPLVRFPPTDELYNNPNCPLKLEASLGLGVYFNAALKVTTDLKQLLPTAGAFLQFHGGLSVMCFSVSLGTIYAVGAVDVKIACDTSVGPNLTLKFGFGAQIVVGLPVVGNVSVLYMIGVEMYVSAVKFSLSGMMLFRGQADLLGGLVCVTITIEAKGTVEKTGDETNCSVQVTFALDISIFLVIDISFSKTWGESRQIA
jgi:hypothetical protein